MINDLLDHSKSPREKEILNRLKEINVRGMEKMHEAYKSPKRKYTELQREPVWSEAKGLIIEFLLRSKGSIKCSVCGRDVDPLRCVLHHGNSELKKDYHWNELFTPSPKITHIIHVHCHNEVHRGDRK